MKIGWIGTGVMGSAMLMHLHQAGYEISVYNRSKEKAMKLLMEGIQVCDTIKACVQDSDMVFTMVGYPKDVEEIYTSTQGILEHVPHGCICIDMTTSSPKLAKQLYQKAKERGIPLLDAPVSGGDSGAKQATLSIMVGGDREIYEQCLPLLSCMGTTTYMGEAGCGQHTKACNQIAVAGAVAAMSEALVYAREHGLDESLMLDAIGTGAGGSWQIQHTAKRVLSEDFEPGFYIKHFIKDMHIIQDEMGSQHLTMLDSVCQMYETLAKEGEENKGTQALIHYYS